jgi:hypothetical protein
LLLFSTYKYLSYPTCFFPSSTSRNLLNDIYFILVDDAESVLTGVTHIDENRRQYDVRELISFASFDIPSDTTSQGKTTDVSDAR